MVVTGLYRINRLPASGPVETYSQRRAEDSRREARRSILRSVEHRMPTAVDIGTLIEKSAEIRKGRPCIAGTGVTVRRIAGWHTLGLTPEEIAAKIEHLTLAQIHAALAYYHANQDEIDRDIAAEEAAIEEIFTT